MEIPLRKNLGSILFITCFILVVNAALFFRSDDTVIGCLVFAGALLLTYAITFSKNILFPAILFCVPLSFSLKGGGGLSIDFPAELMVGLLAIIFLINCIGKPMVWKNLISHPITILLFVELAWMLICSTNSNEPLVSLKRSLVRLTYLIVFYIIAVQWFAKENNKKYFFLLYVAGIIIPIIHTLYRHSNLGFGKGTAYAMSKPFYSDHTIYGAAIAFVIPALLIFLFNYKSFGFNGKSILLIVLSLLVLLTGEIFSFSRAAWVSLFVALIFYFLVLLKMRIQVLIVIILAIGTGVFVFRNELIESVRQNESISSKGTLVEHVESVTNLQTDASNKERLNRWMCAIRMANEKPIFGFGPGMYQFEYGRFQSRDLMTRISTFRGTNGHAHSEMFNALAEEGIPGALIYLIIVFSVIGYGLRVVYRSVIKQERAIALCALLGLVTFYVHGFFNAFLDTDKMAILVFGSIALLICIDINQSAQMKLLKQNQE